MKNGYPGGGAAEHAVEIGHEAEAVIQPLHPGILAPIYIMVKTWTEMHRGHVAGKEQVWTYGYFEGYADVIVADLFGEKRLLPEPESRGSRVAYDAQVAGREDAKAQLRLWGEEKSRLLGALLREKYGSKGMVKKVVVNELHKALGLGEFW